MCDELPEAWRLLEMKSISMILDAFECLDETLDLLVTLAFSCSSFMDFSRKFFCLVFLNSSSLILNRLSLTGLMMLVELGLELV